MGDKDIATKKYIQNNNIFADAFNYLLYNGEQIIKPEQLQELDTTQIGIPHNSELDDAFQRYRDVKKGMVSMTDNQALYLILGVEGQSWVDYTMVIRDMLYDATEYAKQVDEIKKAHRKNKDYKGRNQNDFLSGFYKEDRLVPVVTLVIYFSSEPWDGPKSLHDMFTVQDEGILSHVNNYKLEIIEPGKMAPEDLEKFHTNLKEVLGYVKYANNKEQLENYISQDQEFQKLDRDAVNVINSCTGSNITLEKGAVKVDTCQAIKDIREEGVLQGKSDGLIETCKDFGVSREKTKERLMEKCHLSEEKAEEYLKKFW